MGTIEPPQVFEGICSNPILIDKDFEEKYDTYVYF